MGRKERASAMLETKEASSKGQCASKVQVRAKAGAPSSRYCDQSAPSNEAPVDQTVQRYDVSSGLIAAASIAGDRSTNSAVDEMTTHRSNADDNKSQSVEPPSAQEVGSNTSLACGSSASIPVTGNLLGNKPDGIGEVVMQILLEQQRRARLDEEERQLRLRHLYTSLNSRSESGKGQSDHTISSVKWDNNLYNQAGMRQPYAGVFDGGQQLQGGLTRRDDNLLRLLNQQQLLSLGRAMESPREFPLTAASLVNASHSTYLAQPPLNEASLSIRDMFGFSNAAPAAQVTQLGQSPGRNPMHPSQHLMSHSTLSAMGQTLQASNIAETSTKLFSGGLPGKPIPAETTSYDLVPATPVNQELLQRASYLVSLSQADMSTWRKTRRRFNDSDDDDTEEEDCRRTSKPRSRKKKAKLQPSGAGGRT